jgi:hypothetical protein
MLGCYKYSNELSESVEGRLFLDELNDCQLYKKAALIRRISGSCCLSNSAAYQKVPLKKGSHDGILCSVVHCEQRS